MNYTDLVKSLRNCEDGVSCDLCLHWQDKLDCGENVCEGLLCKEAADAIEELQAAKCPHYIRNVHDCGDDSLCRKWTCEVKALPPKEETC